MLWFFYVSDSGVLDVLTGDSDVLFVFSGGEGGRHVVSDDGGGV